MSNDMIPIGNNAFVKSEKIRILIPADAAKVRRILKKKEIEINSPLLWDATGGFETRTLIVLDGGMMVMSFISSGAISRRINQNNSLEEDIDD